MRVIFLLIDFIMIFSLISFIGYLSSTIIKQFNKDKAWKNWLETAKNTNEINITQVLEDTQNLYNLMNSKIPDESLQSLNKIIETLKIINEKPQTFHDWKTNYSQDSKDLLDIIYIYIPESLNRYFSIPTNYTNKQKHRNGQSSNDLLNNTFHLFEQKFNNIAENLITEKINKLKVYQSFVENKYMEKKL